mmetsp:Transcript_14722/g.25048  ORF Transcript_14722/g.25048 Transcript_14722/m.25048 type:complete len:137 (-) Transcript_14722:212-622(-)
MQDVGQRISEKEKQYADLAIESAKQSMVSVKDPSRDSIDQLMVAGVIIEEEKQQMTQEQKQVNLNIQGEADLVENIIRERKEDINQIASIMSDINQIAKDIAVETQEQGEKLKKLDESISDAHSNAHEGLRELQGA